MIFFDKNITRFIPPLLSAELVRFLSPEVPPTSGGGEWVFLSISFPFPNATGAGS